MSKKIDEKNFDTIAKREYNKYTVVERNCLYESF